MENLEIPTAGSCPFVALYGGDMPAPTKTTYASYVGEQEGRERK